MNLSEKQLELAGHVALWGVLLNIVLSYVVTLLGPAKGTDELSKFWNVIEANMEQRKASLVHSSIVVAITVFLSVCAAHLFK